jgi:hypothetical protein
MEERERRYSFILSRTPHETEIIFESNVNVNLNYSKIILRNKTKKNKIIRKVIKELMEHFK